MWRSVIRNLNTLNDSPLTYETSIIILALSFFVTQEENKLYVKRRDKLNNKQFSGTRFMLTFFIAKQFV